MKKSNLLFLSLATTCLLFGCQTNTSEKESMRYQQPQNTISNETQLTDEINIEAKELEIEEKITELYSSEFNQVDYVHVAISKNGYGDYSCIVYLASEEVGLAEQLDDCIVNMNNNSINDIAYLIPYAPYTEIYKLTKDLLSDSQTNIPVTVYAGLKHNDGIHMTGLKCTDGIKDYPDFEQYYNTRKLFGFIN